MAPVTTIKQKRTVGSLTAEDLGTTISVNGKIFTPMMVIHTVDENSGEAHTMIYENTSLLFPFTVEHDVVFEVFA